jgi:hypothetical protein
MESLPARSVELASALRRMLGDVLGDDLVAMWVHGGTTFADRPLVPGDLDVCVVVAHVEPEERRPGVWANDADSRPYRIVRGTVAVAKQRDAHVDLTFLLASELRGEGLVPDAFDEDHPNTGWAVLRAHLLAGQYVHVVGPAPADLLTPPTDDELRYALDRELEHLERHVHDGDNADPYEATYAMWNGCRILYTLATGSPVVSKRSAGEWGLAQLPDRWHAAIEAAGRSYDGVAADGDVALLRDTMSPFVAWVREKLPPTERRDGPPRWS